MSVEVTFVAEQVPLEVDPDQVDLETGKPVAWAFNNVPDGDLPFIHFDAVDNPFGPFQFLEISASGMTGLGNTGAAGEHAYTALLLRQAGPVAASDSNTSVDNEGTGADTSPFALVIFDPNASPPVLTVDPSPLRVQTGGTAVWYIRGLPEDHFITFDFEHSNENRGPFSALLLSRDFDGGRRLVIGTGSTLAQPDSVVYHLRVRDADGVTVASSDPAIDPLGPPPQP